MHPPIRATKPHTLVHFYETLQAAQACSDGAEQTTTPTQSISEKHTCNPPPPTPSQTHTDTS